MQSVTYRNHPDEVAALQASVPGHHCFGCGSDNAAYFPRDGHWFTPYIQCRCGWWATLKEHEALCAAVLGLEEVA